MADPTRIPLVLCPDMPCEPCGAGSKASRWILCRKCRRIVARCSAHGGDMERVRDSHC